MSQAGTRPTLRDRIGAHIIGRISAGDWTAGNRIPSESEFVAEFGASRMTVHNVLRDLTQRGFLTRRKGAGTYVAEPRPYMSHYPHQDIIEEIEGTGARHTAQVVTQELRPATEAEAGAFDIAPGATLFHAVVVHAAEGVPFELEDRLINPVFLADCLRINLAKRSLFSLLMLARPLRDGEESMQAVIASADDMALLKLGTPAACLELIRRTWTDAGVVTRARLVRASPNAILRGRIAPLPLSAELP